MIKFLRRLLSAKKSTRDRLRNTSRHRRGRLESLERRFALASMTLVDDFDGIPGLEVATIDSNRVTIASTVSGATKSYSLGAWESVQAVELNGASGKELLFNNIRLVNGVPQPAQATVLTFATDQLRTYDVGAPNRFEVADLDGLGGAEVVYTNVRSVNGISQPTTATILNHSTQELASYNVGSPNRFNVVNLDGASGAEIAFTNVRTLNGVPQPASTSILAYASDSLQTYDIGSPNQFDFVNLDGTGGDEIVYTNVRTVNGAAQPATATVLNHTDRRVNHYSVGSPNRVNFVNLDGAGGPEAVFNNMRVVGGVPQPATTSVLSYDDDLVSTYDVGAPNQYEFADLDGTGGVEIVYSNVRSVNGVPQRATATILNQTARNVKSYAVGSPNRLSIVDLDGVAGSELLFDNVRSVGGVPQVAQASVVTYASDSQDTYSLGSPTRVDVADLNGLGGPEVVYTSMRSINGVPQAASAVVLDHSLKDVKSFSIGSPNQLNIVNVDGQAGAELVLTNMRSLNGIPQPAKTTILNYAADETKTYDVGSPNRVEYIDLNGAGGPELVYTNIRVVNGIPQPARASIVDPTNDTIDTYSIGSPNRRDVVDLDGIGGAEIAFSNVRVVNGVPQQAVATLLNHSARQAKSYAVGSPNRMEIRDLDGAAGAELLFDNVRVNRGLPQPAKSTIVTFASDRVQTYDVGTPNAVRVVDLDATGGPELLYTNVRAINGTPQAAMAAVVNATTREVSKYNVSSANSFQVVDLDGIAGLEIVFTNVRTRNGIGQPARTTVIDYVGDETKSYDVGSPNAFQLADLNGAGGPEIVYSNIRVVNGTPLSATATVLDHSNQRVKSYAVGNPNRMQVIDLDGTAGSELLFDNVRVINGVPRPAKATVVEFATDQLNRYDLGSPNRFEVADLDGIGGPEVIYSNVRSLRGVPQTAAATILNQTAATASTINLGQARQLQVRQLDDVAGSELLVLRASTIAVYEFAPNVFTTYNVQDANALTFEDLDGVAGLEVRFVTPTRGGILNHRLEQLI